MKKGEKYLIVKRIKLHTKPLRMADITQTGRFVKETKTSYIFDGFNARKHTIVSIREA